MNLYQIRIVKDIKTFIELNYNDKYIYFDKSNFTTIYLMIIGPKGTPYEDGYLFFKIVFPTNYPYHPPNVEFLNKNKYIRIHPNLYSCGKVCLSILGTWSGPSWKETMSLNTVALSIQSILTENPLTNEPGFSERYITDPWCKDYNIFCIFQKHNLLINDVLNEVFPVVKFFKKEIEEIYKKNIDNLENNLLSYKDIYKIYKIKNKPYQNMTNILDFTSLKLKKFEK